MNVSKSLELYFLEIINKRVPQEDVIYYKNIESVVEISKSIVALSNTNGGDIIFGIDTSNNRFLLSGISSDANIDARIESVSQILSKVNYVFLKFGDSSNKFLGIHVHKSVLPIYHEGKKYILKNGNILLDPPKIFISHSSQDKLYGDVLVRLLRELGLTRNQIIFTSDSNYGIPIGTNIFDHLRKQIGEYSHIIYLLSENYYGSIPCLNEMGAAWMIQNEYDVIGIPTFSFSNPKFSEGAIDPRKIGFLLDDRTRVTEFVVKILNKFHLTQIDNMESNRIVNDVIDSCKKIK